MMDIGQKFYQATKYPPTDKLELEPPAEEPLKTVTLPPPGRGREANLSDLLAARRSRRKFTGKSVPLQDFSYLLWASDGLSSADAPVTFRTAPSAGAKHPLDTYVVVTRVEGLEPGVYKYRVEDHSLSMLRAGDFEKAVIQAAAGQDWIQKSAAVFIWIAVFQRTTERYKERGYRYVLLDAGHICQNLYLAVESLGLGMTGIAALIDDHVNTIVGADGAGESIVYMAAVGAIK